MLARPPPPPLRQSSSTQAVASTSSARVSSSTKHLAPIPSAPLLPLSRSASDPTSTHDRKSRAREPSSPQARVPPPTKKPSDRAKLTELWGSPPKTVKRPDGDIITRGALLGEVRWFELLLPVVGLLIQLLILLSGGIRSSVFSYRT